MHPIIFQSGPLTVRGYGLMLVLSFLVGLALLRARARRADVDPRHVTRLFVLILLAAVVGSRLLFVVEHPSVFAADPWRALRFWEGGLSMLGGLLLAIAVSSLYARAIGEPFAKIADLCAPSIALGEALTRIGCFLNGCCFGTRCDLPWAMVFPAGSQAARVFPDATIHPTQLYASLYSVLIFGVLLSVERKPRRPGYVIGLYLVLHATARFLVELVRYAEPSLEFSVGDVTVTSNQLISLGVFVLGGSLLLATRSPAGEAGRATGREQPT